MNYHLDTNTLAYAVRVEGRIATRLLGVPPSMVGVSAIAAYEVRYGQARNKIAAARARALTALLGSVVIVPFDDECSEVAARIRVDLEARRTPIGPHDILIAATALTHRATLVTRNVKELGRVRGLNVVNWY